VRYGSDLAVRRVWFGQWRLGRTQCPVETTNGEVTEWRLLSLRRQVLAALAGIVFPSGGETDEAAGAVAKP